MGYELHTVYILRSKIYILQEKAPYEQNLARAVSSGPVTVAIEVVNTMYAYGKGVYDEKNCKNQVSYASFLNFVTL